MRGGGHIAMAVLAALSLLAGGRSEVVAAWCGLGISWKAASVVGVAAPLDKGTLDVRRPSNGLARQGSDSGADVVEGGRVEEPGNVVAGGAIGPGLCGPRPSHSVG